MDEGRAVHGFLDTTEDRKAGPRRDRWTFFSSPLKFDCQKCQLRLQVKIHRVRSPTQTRRLSADSRSQICIPHSAVDSVVFLFHSERGIPSGSFDVVSVCMEGKSEQNQTDLKVQRLPRPRPRPRVTSGRDAAARPSEGRNVLCVCMECFQTVAYLISCCV